MLPLMLLNLAQANRSSIPCWVRLQTSCLARTPIWRQLTPPTLAFLKYRRSRFRPPMPPAQESTDATKEITKRIILEIVCNGSVTVSGGSGDGMSEKAVLELLTNNIKPVLMGVIKDEIFEEGQLSYDY